jgi:opacity protein-like surface antigen
MRSVKFSIAAGAATLFSSMAFAADLPYVQPQYAPPVEDFGGWYLRGDIGFSNQSVGSIRNTNPALNIANDLTFNETTKFDTGGTFQLGAGYQFNNWFRADITGQYRGNANFKGTDLFTFPLATPNGVQAFNGIDNYSASKSEWLFLANAYMDLGTWWGVTPFVGAGVGTALVTISNFTDTGVNNKNFNALGVGPFPSGPPVASFATALPGSKWNFAWALHTGLAYKVTPNMTVELAYSYLNLGDGVTGIDSTFDGSAGGHVFKFNNITSQDLKLGIRWELDSPATYAPPPLIRKG